MDVALMTCYVANLKPTQHIHFFDGGDGGYAMAAKQLKGQINEEKAVNRCCFHSKYLKQ